MTKRPRGGEQGQGKGEEAPSDASMDVFNAVADIRMATSRALALLHRQQIDFTADRARAVAELCDGTEASLAAIRDIVTVAALDDATLADFLDENGTPL